MMAMTTSSSTRVNPAFNLNLVLKAMLDFQNPGGLDVFRFSPPV